MAKEYLFYKNTLILFLFIVVLSYFYYIPHFWLIGSDEAIYLASANSLISAEYTFNRLPNLFYYPGTSSVIAIIKLICGNSPLILNIVFTTISVVTLFLIYKTFNKNTLASLITIAIFSVNNQFIKYIYYIRSDILFVFLVYLTFVLWKKFLKDEETSILIVITVVAAFSALVRLEGLFICGTLFLSFSHFFYHKNKHLRTVRPLLIFGVSSTPFILWTWRNYLAYTKDAYNMALNFFFGLGISQASNHTALVIFSLILPVFSFFITPFSNLMSRKHEFQADAFAARHTDANDLISSLVKLYKENSSSLSPDKYYSAFHDTHPSATLRIERLK